MSKKAIFLISISALIGIPLAIYITAGATFAFINWFDHPHNWSTLSLIAPVALGVLILAKALIRSWWERKEQADVNYQNFGRSDMPVLRGMGQRSEGTARESGTETSV